MSDESWEMYHLNNIELIKKHNWSELRNNYWKMAEMLMSEDDHAKAAYFAVCVAFLDINTQNIENIECYRNYGNASFVMPEIAPFVAATISETKNYISHDVVALAYSTFPLPYEPIGIELFEAIINSVAKKGNGNLNKFRKELQDNFINNCKGV